MRFTKYFTGLALTAGMALSGASSLSAQDWRERQDIHRDYKRIERLRADIARDRARLNHDINRGRDRAAARDAADLARDQRALEAQLRDVRHDQRELRSDYRR